MPIKTINHPEKVPKHFEKIVLNYRFEEVVGYGAWGKVKRGWDLNFERPVAIKIMRKHKISRKIRDGVNKIYREFNLLAALDHECIVKYYDLIETNYSNTGYNNDNNTSYNNDTGYNNDGNISYNNDNYTSHNNDNNTGYNNHTHDTDNSSLDSPPPSPTSSLRSFSSNGVPDGKFYLIMEWLGDGCNLTHWIQKKSREERSINSVRCILKKLFEALEYLALREIAHHDIKLDNVIFHEESLSLKLIDFGVSELCPGDASYCAYGTPAYQSPEILTRSDPRTPISGHKSDMWSVGIVAYQLANREGRLPFEGDSILEVFDKIIRTEPDYSTIIQDSSLKNLIKRLLEKNPKKRITAAEALHHPFITGEDKGGDGYFKRFIKSIFKMS